MKLSEFVDEALSQVLAGVPSAQAKEAGQNVPAAISAAHDKGLMIHDKLGLFTVVDFDVSVVAETKGGGEAALSVFSVGFKATGAHSHAETSRIRFSVPVRLLNSDQARLQESNEEARERSSRSTRNCDARRESAAIQSCNATEPRKDPRQDSLERDSQIS